MTGLPEISSVDPATADAIAAEIESAEAETRELYLAQQREQLPDYLDLDDEGNVIPASGFMVCPACRGMTVIPEGFPQSPRYMPCPHCQGFGSVATGSRLKETANITCDSCNGNGYVEKTSWLATHPEDAGRYGDGA